MKNAYIEVLRKYHKKTKLDMETFFKEATQV